MSIGLCHQELLSLCDLPACRPPAGPLLGLGSVFLHGPALAATQLSALSTRPAEGCHLTRARFLWRLVAVGQGLAFC